MTHDAGRSGSGWGTEHSPAATEPERTERLLGAVSAVMGAVAAAALLWIWLLTLPGFNPPNWVRIAGAVWLPVGVVTSAVTGLTVRRGAGRTGALVGLTLTALTLVAFVLLMQTAD